MSDRSKTYYPQSTLGIRPQTVTVGDLIRQLQEFPADLPVIYQMPRCGVFGSGVQNALDGPARVTLEAKTVKHPATVHIDDETGEEIEEEEYVDVLLPWDGVIIQ